MENYTISEYVELPSKGVIYTDKTVAPEVHVSSMTTRHEMQRLAPSKLQFKVLCDILDDCIVGDLGISSYDLYSGDYQFLMFKLRTATYGPEITLVDYCPFCGKTSELKVNLDDLEVTSDIESFNKYRTVQLPRTGKTVFLNYQTPRMLDDVLRNVDEYNDRTNNSQPDQNIVYTLKSMINTVDGKNPDPINIDEWIRNLPMLDVQTITAHANRMDKAIGINTNLTVICDECGKEHKTQLRFGTEFFRPEINV